MDHPQQPPRPLFLVVASNLSQTNQAIDATDAAATAQVASLGRWITSWGYCCQTQGCPGIPELIGWMGWWVGGGGGRPPQGWCQFGGDH